MFGIEIPRGKNIYRTVPTLAENGVSIMNATVMFYGAPKKGKTRTIIESFSGSEYVFLDFDRNYKITADKIEQSGALYFNGSNAYDVLIQLMNGKASNGIFVIDALNSVIPFLCSYWNKKNEDKDSINPTMVGVDDSETKKFFNNVIYPMSENNNSINIIHHTTENNTGTKMAGNKASWMSLFDFTYKLDGTVSDPEFILESGRLPMAPKKIGLKNSSDKAYEFIVKKGKTTITKSEFTKLTKHDKDKWVRDFVDDIFDIEINGSGRNKTCIYSLKKEIFKLGKADTQTTTGEIK